MFRSVKNRLKKRLVALMKYSLQEEFQNIENHFHFIADQQAKSERKLNELIDVPKLKSATGILRKIQLLEVYLLKKLKSICDKLDISFWLHGGTLIGAVRHKGFVPWDDDVDLGMMRDDIEKLKVYLSTHETPFAIDYFYFTEYYYSRQARFVFKEHDIPLCLDIFVYDNVENASDELWSRHCQLRKSLEQEIIHSGVHCTKKHHIAEQSERMKLDSIIENYITNLSDCKSSGAIIFGVEHGYGGYKRLFSVEYIRPFAQLEFEGCYFNAPKHYEEYLENQYGDYLQLPSDFGVQKHTYNYTEDDYAMIKILYDKYVRNYRIGYTAGAFDLFHIGHLNLLRHAKEHCDHLIVGITTDELIEKTKGHKPTVPFPERLEILKSCKYVDEVVAQENLDKVEAWKKYRYNILFSGDDWKGNPRWIEYEQRLEKLQWGGVIMYFPYTQTTSSSKINALLDKEVSHD